MNTPDDLRECISACQRCHDVCARTINHCLEKGGQHAEPAHIRLLFDCVEICETSADFMVRESGLHHLTCHACAEVCERCAEDCDRMSDDAQMRECAETCRACASVCREMSSGVPMVESAEGTRGETEQHAPGQDEIAALAQQLYEEEGRPEGRDQDYWFRAEMQLRDRYRGESAASAV